MNLIPFNPIPYQPWQPSAVDRIRHFERVLSDAGVSVAVRETRGRDIAAACGQLRGHTLVQIERPRGNRLGDSAPDPTPADFA